MGQTRRAVLGAGIALVSASHGSVRRRAERPCPLDLGTPVDARIGFAGDVMLGRDVNDRWRGGQGEGVWDGVADRLAALDGLVLNLECSLADRGSPAPNRGYYFRADPDWAVSALDAAGTAFASLANNHLLDYGPVALADTRRHLAAAGIAHAGAGPDRESAFEPVVASVGDVDVGCLALTDQASAYAADSGSPGTAYLPLDHRNRRTRRLVGEALWTLFREDPDVVVASLHWGPNWEVRPSRDQRGFARWLIDAGVDVVHGHSAHVLQGIETYRGRPILYDLGDFVDDYAVKPELRNDRSALVELVVADGRATALRVVPVEIAAEAVHTANPTVAGWVRGRLRTLSAPFDTPVERDGDGLRIPLETC